MSPAFKLSKDEVSIGRPPLIGEHNEYICKEILGMSDEEFIQMIQEEVLEFS